MHGFPVRTPICHIVPTSRIYPARGREGVCGQFGGGGGRYFFSGPKFPPRFFCPHRLPGSELSEFLSRERKGPPEIIQKFRLRNWLISTHFPMTPMEGRHHFRRILGQRLAAPCSPGTQLNVSSWGVILVTEMADISEKIREITGISAQVGSMTEPREP